MVRGSLLSHLSMPVNSGAVLRVLTGLATGLVTELAAALAAGLATRLAIAAALLATAAANRATIAAVLSRESMSESFPGGEQSGDPGVPVIGMAVLERPLVSGLCRMGVLGAMFCVRGMRRYIAIQGVARTGL